MADNNSSAPMETGSAAANPGELNFKTYFGPNLVVPYAAIVAEFPDPFGTALPAHDLEKALLALYPVSPPLELKLSQGEMDFVHFAAAITATLQFRIWQNASPDPVVSVEGGACRIALGFYDPVIAVDSLAAGFVMARAAYAAASGNASAPRLRSPAIRRLLTRGYERTISKTTATLVRLARARGIPVHPVSERAGTYMFGQGKKGIHFRALANHHDSLTAQRLYQRKDVTSALLKRLGFPGVDHAIAGSPMHARECAQRLGFPLVVKPVDRDFGIGVVLGIRTMEDLDRGFAQAHAASPASQILVERFVPGDHHRITIFNGKFIAVSRIVPATITGDGVRSVEELVGAENVKRRENPAVGFYLASLTIDDEMEALVKKQGFSLGDVPPQGTKLRLRETSNLHTGGTREDATHLIHPDNVAMAESIARSFHLDAMGVDLITPDISKAWHETPCAIVEVNGNPGMSTEKTFERVLSEKFPLGSDGRILTILIVENDKEISGQLAQYFENCGIRAGYTDCHTTTLAGEKRFAPNAGSTPIALAERILGLLLEPSCEALIVSCSAEDIRTHGLPHVANDLALIAKGGDMPKEVRSFIETHSVETIADITRENLAENVLPAVTKLTGEPAGALHDAVESVFTSVVTRLVVE